MMELHTASTPNGWKISIALEELKIPYTVFKEELEWEEHYDEDFARLNPDNKIPALIIREGENPREKSSKLTIYESGAILVYLAENWGQLLPDQRFMQQRLEVFEWLFFQAASIGPIFGQLGHFKLYAKKEIPYAIVRFEEEAKRILSILNTRLGEGEYLIGEKYTIADIATLPWIHVGLTELQITSQHYFHLERWYHQLIKREAVQKGLTIP